MRFGIVGTNFISDKFMSGAKHIDDFQLVSVCSFREERAKSFAERYGAESIFTSYEEMAKAGNIDAVYIATPNVLHYEQTMTFLENGIHVLCEKPMASNLIEVEAMVNKAKEKDLMLMEAMIPTMMPNFSVIKENLSKIGTVRRAVLNFGKYSSRYDAYREGTVLNAFNPELSNGSVMDIGVYSLYNAIALFGTPKKVYANAIMLESGVDGLGTVIISYDDKEVILMHSKITDSMMVSEIQGEDGTIIIDNVNSIDNVTLYKRNSEAENLTVEQVKDNMYYELQEFMNCIKSGNLESKINSHDTSKEVHKVMTEIRKQVGLVFKADR